MRRTALGLAAVGATLALAACGTEREAGDSAPSQATPEELLVGAWHNGEDRFVFDADGTFEGREQGIALRGRYRWLDGDRIEMDATLREDIDTQLVRRVEVDQDELTLIADDGEAVVFERSR